jgi:hypothetical protein
MATIVAAFALAGTRMASAQARVMADFNHDGVVDLAVGAPLANDRNGTVSIFFGVRGVGFPSNTPTFTIPGSYGEYYGFALAVGDFDGNGRADLAVGAPVRYNAAGSIEIIRFVPGPYGGVEIRRTATHQEASGVPGVGRPEDRFGAALAAGDFDDDGYSDLAVGAPGDDGGARVRAGAVTVFRGSPTGLLFRDGEIWHPQRLEISGIAVGDQFGFSLAAGQLDTIGGDDLVIGIPGKDRGTYTDEGAVAVLYAGREGMSDPDLAYLTPSGHARSARAQFGYALAVGNFGGDPWTDLAIGVPRANPGGLIDIGCVVIRPGFRGHFQYFDPIVLTDVPEQRESGALFGWALTSGDFNHDGNGDLAVGSPGKTVDAVADAGAVTIFYGDPEVRGRPPTFASARVWQQNEYRVRDTAERGDLFGTSLTTGDFNDDGISDLAIGIPLEDVGTTAPIVDAGAVSVLYGSTIGVTAEGNHLLVAATRQRGARFGGTVAR